ncbi:MAG TPA: hypothetical protein VGE39_16985 [Prosthecobacter sp.]
MKRAFFPLVLGLLMTAASMNGTEARVLAVKRGSGGSPALLLKIPDNAELSAQDVSALLDAAGSRGPSAGGEKVKAAVNGRRFGNVAVVAPPKPRVITPPRRQPAPSVARLARAPRPKAPAAPAKTPPPPVKPDVTIFDPSTPAKPAPPPPPIPVPQETPEPKKP